MLKCFTVCLGFKLHLFKYFIRVYNHLNVNNCPNLLTFFLLSLPHLGGRNFHSAPLVGRRGGGEGEEEQEEEKEEEKQGRRGCFLMTFLPMKLRFSAILESERRRRDSSSSVTGTKWSLARCCSCCFSAPLASTRWRLHGAESEDPKSRRRYVLA